MPSFANTYSEDWRYLQYQEKMRTTGTISPDSRQYIAVSYRGKVAYKTTVPPFREVEEYQCPECRSIVFLWHGCETQCQHGHTLRLFGNGLYVWSGEDKPPYRD